MRPEISADLADAELANQRSGSWDWVWTGDIDESSVYDPTAVFSD